MNADDFKEMSIDDARSKVVKSGLKGLTKNPGEFYHDFFRWGLWRPDFKEKLSILVEHGLDLNQPICESRDQKITPIFQVLSSSGREVASAIKALVEFGADINLPNKDGRTAIMVASTGKYMGDLSKPSVVKALIKAGADLSIQDSKGNLVTDLADEKALPALVAAGASFNTRKSHALWTAVWGKDLKLTQDLLLKGLKKSLSSWELQVRLPYLETVAQTYPDLFQKGFSLEDTKRSPADKKAVKAFKALRDICAAEPKNNHINAANEGALPPSLRPGVWPPQKVEPTPHVSVEAPLAAPPEFRFPSDLQLECDALGKLFNESKHTIAKKENLKGAAKLIEDTLDYVEKTDWNKYLNEFFGFEISIPDQNNDRIDYCITLLDMLGVSAAQAKIYSIDKYQGAWGYLYDEEEGCHGLKYCKEVTAKNENNYSVRYRIWSNDKNLLANEKFINYESSVTSNFYFLIDYCSEGFSDEADLIWYCYRAQKGPHSKSLLLSYGNENLQALSCMSYLADHSLAGIMANNLFVVEKCRYSLRWLKIAQNEAIIGLLERSFGDEEIGRINSQQTLRLLARTGCEQSILDCAQAFGMQAKEATINFLGTDPNSDFLPEKIPDLPSYFVASAHPTPILKSTGEALPLHAIETLARMILVSHCHLQTPALQEIVAACDRQSLADFAISIFDVWYRNGAKKAGIGFLYALGYLGDKVAVSTVAKTYRKAPPSLGRPLIEVLAAMGSNDAIMALQAIARSSQKGDLRRIAQQVLEDVARDRGLTPEMLEDLAVPDLGLDQDSQMTLDFGPRRFLVSLDANLDAVLTDEGGAILKALPKPVKADDANKAKVATAQWKEFKAALKVQAAGQKKRFEQAMLSRREWDGATFKEVIAVHPLLSRMVRSLVWATLKDQALGATFRIDAEGRYVAADGKELSLDNEARVTLPHPLLLGDTVETWLQIFAEDTLTQPFPQLARKWFVEGPETEKLIRARNGTKVPLGSLRGLKAKGWEFEEGSKGLVWSVYRSIDGGHATIDVEPGWLNRNYDIDGFGGDQTVKLDVSGSDSIAYSELVRDFLSLPMATGEEP